jgi:hypothetical protein
MKLARERQPVRRPAGDRDARLRDLLALHFHPRHGSAYWLQRQERLGRDVRDRVRTEADLWRLGPTPLEHLRWFPVRAFIPRTFHGQMHRFINGETAGTACEPGATAYRDDEFEAAFVTPFLRVAEATGFPRGLPWLWVGPSGPHVIGKAVRELARRTGSMDPFSVDFDPRWAKRQQDGSFGRQRYVEHVTNQALDVLAREEVGVLFTTPPALQALLRQMSDRHREVVRGVHYGGLSISADTINRFREAFPNAVHLAGYGNTLFGVVMEVADTQRLALDYYPLGDRVRFHVVDAAGLACGAWPPVPAGQCRRGRVAFDRLDEGCLLVGVQERDEVERVAPTAEALALGCVADGLRDPAPPAALAGGLRLGLY